MARSREDDLSVGQLSNLKKTTYKDQVTEILRTAILEGTLEPGAPIITGHLSEQLGISRGPIREALSQLEREGLITQSSHRTPRVTSLDPLDAWEIYTLRAILEVLSVRLAIPPRRPHVVKKTVARLRDLADRFAELGDSAGLADIVEMDLEFHALVSGLAGHQRLEDAHGNLDPLVGGLFVSIRKNFGRKPSSMGTKHQAIVDALERALEEGDASIAEDAIWDHHYTRAEEFLGLGDGEVRANGHVD